jgi:LacI family transcriptional regulator
MPSTLRDIARKANVSPSLVSGVLNERPGVWASAQTRERIFQTARDLNYRASSSARALVTGRTMQIAVVADAWLWGHLQPGKFTELHGLIEAVTVQNYRALILPPLTEAVEDLNEALGISQSDGFCVFASRIDRRVYESLEKRQAPFVVIGNPGDASLLQVDQDNDRQMRDSTRWLGAQGHKRIMLVHPTTSAAQTLAHHRIINRGYRDAMKKIGGNFDVVITPPRPLDRAMIRALIQEHAPTAVIARTMSVALQWRAALEAQGKRVPKDAVVLAHLSTAEDAYMKQCGLEDGLAAHVHDPHEVGRRAGELLLNCIEGKSAPAKPILVSGSGPQWCV